MNADENLPQDAQMTLILIIVLVAMFVLFSLGYGLFHLIKEA